jgi:tetratricopeptide (TPR) repeat protein
MRDRLASAAVHLPRRGRRLVLGIGVGLLGALIAKVWWWRPADPDRLFREIRAQLDGGHPDRAEAMVNELRRLRDPTPFDRLLRAQVDEAQHRPDEALAELSRVEDSHPLAPVARILAGQIEVKRFRLRAAETHFLRAIALKPQAVQPHRELVFIYNIQQRQSELDAQLFALSNLDALTFDQLVHWGKTRNVVWNAERDVVNLAKVIEADPADRWSRLALAEGLRRMSRLDESEQVLAPLPGSDADALVIRAMIALDRDDPQRFEQLLAHGPKDHPVLAGLKGKLDMSRGDWSSAIANLRRAYEANPHDRSVLHALGTALRSAGDIAKAEPFLAAARRHDALTPLISQASARPGSQDPLLPARLGAACEAAGRLAESLAWY